ncbi:hypothetical protein [Ramlibacter sp. PS4R-6]|uniref:hypothetical protein n=1 Tax=Ramlibacter sp. PS4R-6 TaxID=3133438 RepID=UPI00309B062D
MSWRCFAHLACAAALAATGLAAGAAPLVLGVQTHVGYMPARTDAAAFRAWMQRSRFGSARDEMFWWDVETSGTLELQRGALNSTRVWQSMPPPFAALLTLDFGHPGYDGGGQPQSPRARAAFARYAAFAVARAQPQVQWAEVWNEWNLKSGARAEGGSNGGARDYVALAAATYAELKAAHPGVQVLAGSAGDDIPGWPWMREALAHGLLSHADGVALHLYNHCTGAAAGSDELATRLDAMRALMSAAGKAQMPVFVTEVGWPTHKGACETAEPAAALHALRFLLEASVRPWVAGVWFYELQDGGDDAANPEHHFGLLRRDGTEKPAGCVLRELGALVAQRPVAHAAAGALATASFRIGSTDRWLLWPRGRQGANVQLDAAGEGARFSPVAVCGLPSRIDADASGRSATLRIAANGVQVIDVPAGTRVTMRQLP